MEITKREVLASVAIICIMLILGLLIQQSIRTSVTNQNKEYELAIQIEDPNTFEYAMQTNVGNAFVYGELIAVDPITNAELDGKWMWIQKVKEKYTRHERIVTVKSGKTTTTKVEYYWTWDRVGSEEWHSEKIKFLGKVFPYGRITDVDYEYIKTDKQGNIRFKWYASTIKHKGTIYTKLENGTITKAKLIEGKTAKETFDSMIMSVTGFIIGFWILWTALTAGLCFGFYSLENRWLE